MKILLVDVTVLGQSALAKRIESFDAAEQELLNIEVNLASPDECLERVREFDLVILGSELGDRGPALAREIKLIRADIEVLVFVSDSDYSSGVFRLAHGARARKVLPESALNLDLLQEIINIHEAFCAAGKMRRGRLITVLQAKGGVGATTLVAALGEAFAARGARTVLWDLDIETFDLSRALCVADRSPKILGDWFNGLREPNRATIQDALVPLSSNGWILPAPADVAVGNRMVGEYASLPITERISSLLRFSKENLIVDLAGRLGPQSLALLKASDAILLIVDDSTMGLTAIRSLLSAFSHQRISNLFLVGSACKMRLHDLAEIAQITDLLRDTALDLPIIPFDSAAALWPGQGRTLFSMGRRKTVHALSEIVNTLEIALNRKVVRMTRSTRPVFGETLPSEHSAQGGFRRLLGKVSFGNFK